MLQRLFKKSNHKGFTLIELLVVVAIIGILMTIGISNYIRYRASGADQAEQADAANFLTLAMAQVAATNPGGNTVFGVAAGETVPDGYVQSPDITIAGNLTLDTAGLIPAGAAPTITFTHSGGDMAANAAIVDDGNGNPQVQ